MTRNPVILAGLSLALFAAPAWAQSDIGKIPASASPDPATVQVQTKAPVKQADDVRADRLKAQHKEQDLAAQQKALAAQRKAVAAQQQKLAAQQRQLAAQQRKLADERRQVLIAEGKIQPGCGSFAGHPRDAQTCSALKQQAAILRLGPYDRPYVAPGS